MKYPDAKDERNVYSCHKYSDLDVQKLTDEVALTMADELERRKKLRIGYMELFRDVPSRSLSKIRSDSYIVVQAVIETLAKRGEYDRICRIVDELTRSNPLSPEMQRHISSTLLRYKQKSIVLWAYATALNRRAAFSRMFPDRVARTISFDDFINNIQQEGDDAGLIEEKGISGITIRDDKA